MWVDMNFLSLFSGVGGMDLGLERAGMRCVGQVEINPFCRRVLAKHWPDVPRFEDVRTFTKDSISESIDLIAGGFPCQDVSQAGLRIGIDGGRSGLWSEFNRIIRDVRPRYVLVENAAGLLARGMGRVLGDLAAGGFDAEWSVLPACALGASHSRPRVFLAAHAKGERSGQLWGFQRASEGEARRDIPWPKDEPGIPGEVDGIPGRVDRLVAIGNAVVPQVAEWIGRRLMQLVNTSGTHLDSKTKIDGGTGLHPTPSDGSASGGNGDNTAPTEPPFFVGIESRDTSTDDANAVGGHELAEKTVGAGGGLDSVSERFFGNPPSPVTLSPSVSPTAGGGR
jgi:DNA (cytosine-5)-methyltransferase 1